MVLQIVTVRPNNESVIAMTDFCGLSVMPEPSFSTPREKQEGLKFQIGCLREREKVQATYMEVDCMEREEDEMGARNCFSLW